MTPLLDSNDKQEKAAARLQDEDEEEDYMTMLIPDAPRGAETSLQRHERQKREGEIRGRPKSKKELEEDEYVKRETALMTSLDTSTSKGFKMMERLGYKPGTGLGRTSSGRIEPIQLSMKEDKSGIGLENDRKRKFREEMEKSAKRTKAEEIHQLDYRQQMRQEKEAGRAEHQFMAAQRAIEHIESRNVEEQEDGSTTDKYGYGEGLRPIEERQLKSIDIVWRGLIRHRRQQGVERTRRRMVRDFIDDEEDILADSTALTGKRKKKNTLEDENPDEEDEELDEFNALEPQDKLMRAVEYLREKYHYCFWCKYRYPDDQMEGCPGLTEEDHE